MADESDVEAALVLVAAGALYPNGTGQASALLNATPVRCYRGWPVEQNLKKDCALGVANVSVFARNGVERNVTRYPRDDQELSRGAKTLTATVNDQSITLGGTVTTPQNVVVQTHRASVAYAVQANDTLTTIATALATLLAALFPGTTNTGPVVTIPASAHAGIVTARVGVQGVVGREVKRQDKSFQISLWAPTPEVRDSLAKTVDPALAALTFVALADGTKGWIRYEFTIVMDTPSEEGMYRRDLFYTVEYPTMTTEIVTEITGISVGFTGGQSDPSAPSNPQAPTVPVAY